MTKIYLPLIAALMISAAPVQAEGFSADQKKEVNALIEAFIKENPKVMLDSVVKYQEDQAKIEQEKADSGVKNFVPSLAEHKDIPFTGNEKGDVTVVEFFDYNCGYCKKAYAEVQKLLDADKNVKVVFIDLPILGPASHEASKWALAAQTQGKYFEFHKALMNFQGEKNEETLSKLAVDAGLDVEKLKKDKEDKKVEERLTKNAALAASVTVSGTPAFIVDSEIVRGYVPYDSLKTMIDTARKPDEKAKP